MIFKICNDNLGSMIFEIEFWLSRIDDENNLYQSNIRVSPYIGGIIDIVDLLIETGGFDKNKLKSDFNEVNNLVSWLWQQKETGQNDGLTIDKASDRHYHVFLPYIMKVVYEFCDKYEVFANED